MFSKSRLKIFSIIGLISSVFFFFLVAQHRLPILHDTFQYLQLQYIYFNEMVQHHQLPLWFPFMGQGLVGNLYFTAQTCILSPVMYFLGLFLKDINYLYLFYVTLWFDELFFLLGIILLSSLYYKDARTVFFVSATLLGTDIWYPQIWWNFHLYYFIPLVLYCLHQCLITGRFRYLVFSLLFFTLSVYGNFLYCGIFISFVILIYGLCIALLHRREARAFLRRNITSNNIVVLLILITVILLSFHYILYGLTEIAYQGGGRDSHWQNRLGTFLTYGGSAGFSKYKEFLTMVSNSIDINLYGGFLLIPFAIIAFLYVRNRLSLAVGGVAWVILFFSAGTLVSILFYYLFPLGRYFRHIGLTATVFKLFIVFYAGFGFDIFLERVHKQRRWIILILVYLLTLIVLFSARYATMDPSCFWYISKLERGFFSPLLNIILVIAIILFFLLYKTRFAKNLLINLLLLLIAIDVFSYKYSLLMTRMPRVSDEAIALLRPYKYEFLMERSKNTLYAKNNKRVGLFDSLIDNRYVRNQHDPPCAIYNTTELFLFTDSAVSLFRTDFLLKSISKYFEAIKDFPNRTRAYERYSGVGCPKLAGFSRLNVVDNKTEMGKIFSRDDFAGDMLFTTVEDIQGIRDVLPLVLVEQQDAVRFKNRDERVNVAIEIRNFSFNMLNLKVVADGPAGGYYFLYYSDAYHPHWSAYVRGKKVPVIKSNIGYKSVMVPYGASEVVFKFGNAVYFVSFFCYFLIGIMILGAVIYIFVFDFWPRTQKASSSADLP